jgi:hypothetical protein
MLRPTVPIARPLVPAIPGNVSNHHEEEEISVLIGDDGMYYSTEYPRQDSNRSKKAQGKQYVSKIVPPPVPPLASSMPLELVELWPTLTDAQQAELLRVARAMRDQATSEKFDCENASAVDDPAPTIG